MMHYNFPVNIRLRCGTKSPSPPRLELSRLARVLHCILAPLRAGSLPLCKIWRGKMVLLSSLLTDPAAV